MIKVSKFKVIFLVIVAIVFITIGIACNETNKQTLLLSEMSAGLMCDDLTYQQTIRLFQSNGYELVQLVNGTQKLAVCPSLGGRVVAATFAGDDGFNPFFVNPVDIKGGPEAEKLIFRGAIGARDWLGPEGCGDMSFYFHKKPIVFENWYVDDRQNLPKMKVEEMSSSTNVVTTGEIHINNLRGNQFDIRIEQKAELITKVSDVFDIELPAEAAFVGVRRTTTFENIGNNSWDEEYGYSFIWYLAMLRASDESYVIVPYKDDSGPIVIDYRFNDNQKIASDRLMLREEQEYIVFRADGSERGKIGFTPKRTLGIVYSVDISRQMLCALKFDLYPEANYMNNLWTENAITTGGNALDIYNNTGGNPVLPGRFYELEAVSPRLELEPGQSFSLRTTICFFHSSRQIMNHIISKTGNRDISGEKFME